MRKYSLSIVKNSGFIKKVARIALNIKNFNLEYSNFILDVPDLKFYSNSIYLLLGNNGTGKTSFLKTLAGLNNADLKQNKILSDLSTKKRARFISYMPQVYAIPDISVFNFLLHARYPFVKGLYGFGAEDFIKVNQVLDFMKLDYLKKRVFSSLSGGEQLKILIARIYVLDPKIILFDEPTSFLDKPSRQDFVKHINELKNIGKTIIIVSHDDYLFNDFVDLKLEIK